MVKFCRNKTPQEKQILKVLKAPNQLILGFKIVKLQGLITVELDQLEMAA